MQRQATTSRAAEPSKSWPFSPRRKMEENTVLPQYVRNSFDNKKEISRSRLAEKLVHLIPVVVLLCFFILWWFSYPVNLKSMNGRTVSAYELKATNTVFFSQIFPPYPSISEMMGNDSIV